MTLPVILAYARGTGEERKFWEEAIAGFRTEESHLMYVCRVDANSCLLKGGSPTLWAMSGGVRSIRVAAGTTGDRDVDGMARGRDRVGAADRVDAVSTSIPDRRTGGRA
mgnify:CR=1 FL=1